mmetsp:Transcript_17605/g.40728  ORF Transcript_17605/g.40728 Transcript_17605/m.40728 type:complete len:425 (-) Transcript_17605:130-1404(-)
MRGLVTRLPLATVLTFATPAAAWWDEGHLLVATIARRLVSNPSAFEQTLQRDFQPEFSNYSDLVNASVWADFIKSQEDVCLSGLESLVTTRVFNGLHHTNFPYNPFNVPASELSSMIEVMPLGVNDVAHGRFGWIDGVTALAEFDRSLRSNTRHSSFAWNLQLRLALHILADLHQPLHTASMFSKRFPAGDRNAHNIKLNASLLPPEFAWYSKMDLHNFWDACADQYTRRWPVSDEILQTEVDELLAKHGKEANMLGSSWQSLLAQEDEQSIRTFFQNIAKDTSKLVPDVYEEFLRVTDASSGAAALKDPALDLPAYQLTMEYVRSSQDICGLQLVLAGFRLAAWLGSIEPYIPAEVSKEERKLDLPNAPSSRSQMVVPFVVGLLVGGLLVVLLQLVCKPKEEDIARSPLVTAQDKGGVEFEKM